MKLSIIIPCYNEESTIKQILNRVLDADIFDWEKEIIIVNDASKDSSELIIKSFIKKHKNIHLINNSNNQGKTQSVKKGILNSSGDFILIQDADLEYDPNEYKLLLKQVEDFSADVVYGNRFGKSNKVIYWKNYLGNRFLSFVSNIFTYPRIRVFIPDMEVCYKLIKGDIARELAKRIASTSNFGFEPEITARLSIYSVKKTKLNFKIVPISYFPRTISEGKHMKPFKDGFKALMEVFRYNVRIEG